MKNDDEIPKQKKKRLYEFAVMPYLESLDAFSHRDTDAFPALRVFFALSEIARGQREHQTAVSEKSEPFYAKYDEIQKIAHINRSEISRALNFLRERGIIGFSSRPGVRTQYRFCFGESKRWVQVPRTFFKKQALKVLSLTYTHFAVRERHQFLLNALKLYLYLLMKRDNRTNRAYVPYDAIEIACKIKRSDIRKTSSILMTEDLITIESRYKPKESKGYKRASNAYFITGLRDFRSLPNLVPIDSPAEDEDYEDFVA